MGIVALESYYTNLLRLNCNMCISKGNIVLFNVFIFKLFHEYDSPVFLKTLDELKKLYFYLLKELHNQNL